LSSGMEGKKKPEASALIGNSIRRCKEMDSDRGSHPSYVASPCCEGMKPRPAPPSANLLTR
jgi:hypothetical protein